MLRWLKLFARPRQQTNLILLGGEPTMHPDLAIIIKAAKAMRFAVTVDTNGYLFHDLLDKITPQELDYLSFSLDGPEPAINDPIRGQGVFEVCTANIRRAVAQGFNTSLIYTASGMNIDHLHRMPELLTDLGVRRFFIQVIGLRGNPAKIRPKGEVIWQVDPEHWLSVVPQVAADAARRGIHVIYPKVYLDPRESFHAPVWWRRIFSFFPTAGSISAPCARIIPSTATRFRTISWSTGKAERGSVFLTDHPEGCVMNGCSSPIISPTKRTARLCIVFPVAS